MKIEFTHEEIFYKGSDDSKYNGKLENSIKDKFKAALENTSFPQKDDRCAFWNDDKQNYIIATLKKITKDRKYVCDLSKEEYDNCAKIIEDAVFE